MNEQVEIGQILNIDRLVQPKFRSYRCNLCASDVRGKSQTNENRIAGRDCFDDEYREGDSQKYRDYQNEPFDNVAKSVVAR